MKIIYSNDDLKLLQKFRCSLRAGYANKRFDDKICRHDVYQSLQRFNFKCGYCCRPLDEKWQLDHFYARAVGGKNVNENLVPTCRWCNTMKSSLDGFSFLLKCHTVATHNQIQDFVKIKYSTPRYLRKKKKNKLSEIQT